MSAEALFGWDLLFKTIESQVNSKTDILIALVHYALISTKFRCIGVGDDKTLSDDEESSELLPSGWNNSTDKYALRYVYEKKLYILLATKSEHVFIINLLDVDTKNVSNIGLDTEDVVKATKGPLKTMIPTSAEIMDRLRKELLDPVFSGTTKTGATQTQPEPTRERRGDDHDPLRIGFPQGGPRYRGSMGSNPYGFPGPIGSGDLDPLGRGGGNLGVLPQFGPPVGGIRFDPFGPSRGVRPNPNNDEFPPPGFGDYFN